MNKILLIVAAILISGCDNATEWLEKQGNQKTTLGYSQCLKENENAGLSYDTLERLCIKKHEKRMFGSGEVSGRAGYDCNYSACSFSGYMENISDRFVVTKLEVSIYHEDNLDKQGNMKAEFATSPQLWIEPGKSERVHFRELDFHPAPDRIQNEDGFFYSWNISEIWGIAVKLN